MLPIVLSEGTSAGLTGAGDGLRRRMALLEKAGITNPMVFPGVPTEADLAGLQVLFVAGLDEQTSAAAAAAARAAGVLVNVEDQPALCDFHVPAQIRRGDLLFTISTAGRSPGLSRILREVIEANFGEEWEKRLEELAAARAAWRAEGLKPDDVSARTRALLVDRGWVS
jgi:precorrin-2 dehydrogenase/sirohydrochlorin ferrochelatase